MLAICCLPRNAFPGTIHVDLNSPSPGDGRTWFTAFTDLQTAIEASHQGDEIWVAKGTYLGTQVLLTGQIEVYGGFEGALSSRYPGGEAQRSERDPNLNPTILTGDVLGDDDGLANRSENLKNIVQLIGTDSEGPLIDGFVITGSVGSRAYNSPNASAIIVQSGNCTISGCVVIDNVIKDAGPCSPLAAFCADGPPGAGIFVAEGATAHIRNCTISDNKTGRGFDSTPELFPKLGGDGGAGAGIFCDHYSRAIIEDCAIVDNATGDGGLEKGAGGGGSGVYCNYWSSVILRRCTISGNRNGRGGESCRWSGGRGGNGGGVYGASNGTLVLENCTFTNNQAGDGADKPSVCGAEGGGGDGGAIFSQGVITMKQCHVVNNTAGDGGERETIGVGGNGGSGGGLFLGSPKVEISECSVIGNQAGKGGSWGGSGGGIIIVASADSVSIINSIIAYNQAGLAKFDYSQGSGGGIAYGYSSEPKQPCRITNLTIYGNNAPGRGAGIMADNVPMNIWNSIIWNNRVTGTFPEHQMDTDWMNVFHTRASCIEGLSAGIDSLGNLGADPEFENLGGPDGLPGNDDDAFDLGIGSPCLNAGDNGLIPALATADYAGLPRIHAGIVDMGALENQRSLDPVVLQSFVAAWEANQTRLLARLSHVEPQARARMYWHETPELAGRVLMQEMPLTPGSEALEFVDTTAPLLESRWYSIDFIGADRGLVRAGPVEGKAQYGVPVVSQPGPNPFSSEARVTFIVPATAAGNGSRVIANVYSPQGALVRRVLDAHMAPGTHQLSWDARNSLGVAVPRGVYFLQLSIGTFRHVSRLVRSG